jgi:hypothetical protein
VFPPALHRVAADAVLLLHLAFIVFAAIGGLAVLRWPRLAWLHLPVASWAALIEFGGWICPLTPLEVALRRSAGQTGFAGGFIEHYLTAIIYPQGLTRAYQVALGAVVVLVNLAIYWRLLRRARR